MLKNNKYISFVMAIISGGVAFFIVLACIFIILAVCPPLRKFCGLLFAIFLSLLIGSYIGVSGGYSEYARNMINSTLVSITCIIIYFSHKKKKQKQEEKERVEHENRELLNQLLKEKIKNQSKDEQNKLEIPMT